MREYSVKTPEQLGAILRGVRRERAYTQTEAGLKAGLRQSALSQLESNPGRSSLKRIFQVLAALDLEVVVRPRSKAHSKAEW